MQFRFANYGISRIVLTALVLGLLVFLPVSNQPAQANTVAASDSYDTIYVVKVGDTLSSIARAFGVTTSALASVNNLSNANFIYVGQQLVIPSAAPTATPTKPSTTTLPPTPMPTPTRPSTTTLPPTPVPTPTQVPIQIPTVMPVIQSPWSAPSQLVEIFSPVAQTSYHSPIQVAGLSRTFESTVAMRLVDEDGNILAERAAMGGGVDGYDFFETYIRFFVNEPTEARLEFLQTAGESDDLPVQAYVELTLLPDGQRTIDLLSPAVNAAICDDINIAGYSLTFEGNVIITLTERDGTQIAQTFATGGGTSFRDWQSAIANPATTEPMALLLSVHEESARDGSTIDMTRHPISVYPADHPACSQ